MLVHSLYIIDYDAEEVFTKFLVFTFEEFDEEWNDSIKFVGEFVAYSVCDMRFLLRNITKHWTQTLLVTTWRIEKYCSTMLTNSVERNCNSCGNLSNKCAKKRRKEQIVGCSLPGLSRSSGNIFLKMS